VQLDLSSNQLGNAGALALAESPYLHGLRRLQLAANSIGHDARQALGRAFPATALDL